jgi:hypothetical protein
MPLTTWVGSGHPSEEPLAVSFDVNYLLSEFSPYNALLMQYRLRVTAASP